MSALMLPASLSSIDCWIFDLDNSLYPASSNLFELIDIRMGEYISKRLGCTSAEARTIQKGFFRDHGTTLAGLMKEHGVRPRARTEAGVVVDDQDGGRHGSIVAGEAARLGAENHTPRGGHRGLGTPGSRIFGGRPRCEHCPQSTEERPR
jgi:hypothetical protein